MTTKPVQTKILISISVLFFIITFITTTQAITKVDNSENNQAQETNKFIDGVIECSGKLKIRNCCTIRLTPGEQILEYLVKNEMNVKKGTSLVRLKNDSLKDRQIMLQEKLMALEKEQNSVELIKIKMVETEKKIERIRKLIDEEKAIKSKAPFYQIEEKVKSWTEEIQTNESRLSILRKELELNLHQASFRTLLFKLLNQRLASVQNQLSKLTITAPFDGIISKIPLYRRSIFPGDVVLEIYDWNSFEVELKAWQHHLKYIKPGCKVQIYPFLNQNSYVWGTVRSIGLEGVIMKNEGVPFFTVLIDLDKCSSEMRPGMVVTGKIQIVKEKGTNAQ